MKERMSRVKLTVTLFKYCATPVQPVRPNESVKKLSFNEALALNT